MKIVKHLSIFISALTVITLAFSCSQSRENTNSDKPVDTVVGAYIWDGISDTVPIEAQYFTHLFMAFGQINDTHDGIVLADTTFMRRCAALKESFPHLKVLLSLGGAEMYGFSEMAADSLKRLAFAKDCKRVIDEFGIDGIDIDWEVPGNWHGLLCEDWYNNVKMLRDVRGQIGNDNLLTIASPSNLSGILVDRVLPYIDFINVMTYDMGAAPRHHTAMYRSDKAGCATVDETLRFYLDHGVPKDKIVMGLAFYGRSDNVSYPGWTEYWQLKLRDGDTEHWDEVAMVPYITDSNGNVVLSYENPRSLQIKCDYIKEQGLRGAMYWRYGYDDEQGSLRRTVAKSMLGVE